MKKFQKSFTQQLPIPEDGISLALNVMKTGRLHRYNTLDTEKSVVDQFEIAFSNYIGVDNCLSCASCGYALHIALKSVGVKHGDKVLCNSFTLAPVPGAIDNAGAIPVLVDIDFNLCIDIDDLEYKAKVSGARFLLLSHMRGHIADMDEVMKVCHKYKLILIEDCAHTMGAKWSDKYSGTYGDVACFSTQTYKHLNSGEGGILITPHDDVMAKAIIYSGSYMFYNKHYTAPEKNTFENISLETPNYSGRMDNLRAAVLLPQLEQLEESCIKWNALYEKIASSIQLSSKIKLIQRNSKEKFVGSSIQFRIPEFNYERMEEFILNCNARGVVLKWFGNKKPEGYTSRYDDWLYLNDKAKLINSNTVLSTLVDMRLPLTFDAQDCDVISSIILEEVDKEKQ